MHIDPHPLPTGHSGIAARLKKGPTIHPNAWIVPGAIVIGDVALAEESSVWYGAVLRGDINRIVVGPRSNIQDNAVVHLDTGYPTIIGELVTVGHGAIVHACKIDNEVLVGMGAIILDDVEVGARSIIGANALVTLATKIPHGSLVLGSPAKIRRSLSLDEQNDIARWAWSYVETAKQFREFTKGRTRRCNRGSIRRQTHHPMLGTSAATISSPAPASSCARTPLHAPCFLAPSCSAA